MKIGIALPAGTPVLGPEMLTDIAQAAESLGFYSLWTFDRLFWAVKPRNAYAGRYDPWPKSFKYTFDPLDLLTFLAGRTERVRLGTSVINAPFYNPVLLARRLTTIDIVSNGRLTVGMGLGWSEDEFIAAGVPMERRGARMNEYLQVLNAIWRGESSSFEGEFYELPQSVFGLKPIQKPRPPLLLGTFSEAGLKRAGRLADGWNPIGLDPGRLQRMGDVMRQAAVEAGRDADALQIVMRADIDLRERALGQDRRPMSGDVEQIADDLQKLKDAGATEIFTGAGSIDPDRGHTVASFIERLQRLTVLLGEQ